MKRILISAIAFAALLAMTTPVSAGKPVGAYGSETFFLTPTCDPGPLLNPGPAFEPACRTADGNVTITVSNPGSREGTFTGEQLFEGTITVFKNLDFQFRGTLTFTGTVEGCGEGTVVWFNEGSGNFATGLSRNVQHSLPNKGTLGVRSQLTLTGTGPNTNSISGTVSC